MNHWWVKLTTHRQAHSHIHINVGVTEPAPHTQSTHNRAREAVTELLICGEKLLSSILRAEIHFSEEIRPRFCCYSNSQSHLHSHFPTTSPWILWAAISIMHREWPRLSLGGPFPSLLWRWRLNPLCPTGTEKTRLDCVPQSSPIWTVQQ